MSDSVAKALLVMVTDPKINTFLQHNDPQALKQATTALRDYFDSNTLWLSGATTCSEWYGQTLELTESK